MKIFIKNSYLFLIFFIIFICKDFFLSFINIDNKVYIKDEYTLSLEKKIKDIELIQNNKYKVNYEYGYVIYQNPYYFNDNINIIYNNKIYEKDYVLDNNGLIGIVDKVYKGYATVKLITNSNLLLQVKVNNCYAVLNNLKINDLNNYCNVKINDKVYTSSLGNFNENYLVGYISNIENNVYYVTLAANMNDFNYVIIVSGNNI